jgi:hypothetical protein
MTQNGIYIGASSGVQLRDVIVERIPGNGIVGRKSPWSTYWNGNSMTNVRVSGCGGAAIEIGKKPGGANGMPVDDLALFNCVFTHACESVDPEADALKAGVFISCYRLTVQGCEISRVAPPAFFELVCEVMPGEAILSSTGAPFDELTGSLYGARIADMTCGSIGGLHFEGCGNDQPDSVELQIVDARGGTFHGLSFFVNDKDASRTAVELRACTGILMMNPYVVTGNTHQYERIVSFTGSSETNASANNTVIGLTCHKGPRFPALGLSHCEIGQDGVDRFWADSWSSGLNLVLDFGAWETP